MILSKASPTKQQRSPLGSRVIHAFGATLLVALMSVSASAEPALQLYLEGATYDQGSDTWVASGGDSVRLWTIGAVGEVGTISNVRLAIAYDSSLTDVDFTLTPSTTGGEGGFTDPSTPGAPTLLQTVTDGSLPQLTGGGSIGNHGEYGDGTTWQEFALGDFTLTDSPIADFINSFPTPTNKLGQINVYEITFTGADSSATFHFDLYDSVVSGNKARAVFAPFSHDAEVNPPPVPEPASLATAGLGVILGLGYAWRRRKRVAA
jgi:hypothetical protein